MHFRLDIALGMALHKGTYATPFHRLAVWEKWGQWKFHD
jgi:hypothetical protein